MGAAFVGVDVVHEGERVLVVAVLVLQGDIDVDVVLDRVERDRLGMGGLLVPVQPLDELGQPALGVERFALALFALVLDRDRDPLVEERELSQPVRQGGVVELENLEDLRVGLEADRRAGAARLAEHIELLHRLAADERHVVPVAVAVHDHLEPLGQGVHDRDADAVQAARHLVGVLVELAPGVEQRERHLDGRQLFGGMDVDRDSAAVIGDRDRVVGMDGDVDRVAEAGERLVDRVVHHLVDQMVQAGLAGGSDVHARTPADGLQTLENADGSGVVGLGRFGRAGFSLLLRHVPRCSLGLRPIQ